MQSIRSFVRVAQLLSRDRKLLILQFLTVIILVALDQITKLWIVTNIPLYSGFSAIEKVFSIYHTVNTGAGWSLLSGQTALLIAVPVVAVIAMVYVLTTEKIKPKTGVWGITLILAGAVGNLIDRIFRGGEVVDMIKLEFIDFPVFNVADICVTVGAVLFFIYVIFFYEDRKEKKDE